MPLRELISSAKRAARNRMHSVRQAKHEGSKAVLRCRACGLEAVVDACPPPNGATIVGELVALNCWR